MCVCVYCAYIKIYRADELLFQSPYEVFTRIGKGRHHLSIYYFGVWIFRKFR